MLHHLSPAGEASIARRNELRQSTATLLGIVQGMLADDQLTDTEIHFLAKWLDQNTVVASEWPGHILRTRVAEILQDGRVTEEERSHLVELLQAIIGDRLEGVPDAGHVTQLPMDKVPFIQFDGRTFCFTGEFAMGPRSTCAAMTEKRGGIHTDRTNRDLDYLIVGSLGSKQWKNNSFGTKIDAIIKNKASGKTATLIVSEDDWATALSQNGSTGL